MKALVLAGGSGTRLRPFTHSMPKQLVPVAGRPVLAHVLDLVGALGVTEIGVVVGDKAADIEAAVGDGSDIGARVTYIPQERPLGLAHAVRTARPFLGDDDFVMLLGDNVLLPGVGEAAEDFRARRAAAQVVVQKVADPRHFGVAEIDAEGAVLAVVEKPREPRGDLALIGVYFFTPEIHRAVDAIRPSARGELEITDAIQWLVASGAPVRATEYTGFWKDTGRPEDLLACNRRLLEGLEPRVHGEVDASSRLTGRVVVERGARVVRSRIEGPVVIGAGTVVEDCDIGPHTSIGADCELLASAVADSVIMEGTRVLRTRGLAGSLIGRSAVIAPPGSREVPGELLVGDHSLVVWGR
ncbi:glucose-1-phosphate thymidylyltransferase [Streptomyces californicus]|uniref:glucose-1-phosphate thymidylyltransferase n=1 Tax=Streptomyces californicus TaxID=67351 RepID=UPI0036DE14B5